MFAIFFIWIAVGAIALVVGAIAVRVSSQRLNRSVAPLSEATGVNFAAASPQPAEQLQAAA